MSPEIVVEMLKSIPVEVLLLLWGLLLLNFAYYFSDRRGGAVYTPALGINAVIAFIAAGISLVQRLFSIIF